MSDNPMQDIDAELSAITRAFGTASTMIISNAAHHRGSGQSRVGSAGAPRQTLAPSARRIRRMSTGRLTGYMWKTHLRGASGINVAAETRRISSELDARGLVGVNHQWRELVNTHPHHTHVQQGPAQNTQAQTAHTVQAVPTTAHQSAPQQVAHQWATPQIAAAVAGLGVGAGASAMVGDQLADAVDQHLVTLGFDGHLNGEQFGEEGYDPTAENAEANLDAGVDPGVHTGLESGAQPSADTGVEATGATGLAGAENPDDVAVTGQEATSSVPGGDTVSDLVAVGATAEAVDAGQFGAGAFTGEIGQALADETGSDGLSATPEAEQSVSPTNAQEAAAPEPSA